MRLILLALLVAIASPLHGQFVAASVDLPMNRAAVTLPDSARHARSSHWKVGLIAGAAIGALAGVRVANHLCAMDESDVNCLGPSLLGATLLGGAGGAIGALIGSLFPKETSTPAAGAATSLSAPAGTTPPGYPTGRRE